MLSGGHKCVLLALVRSLHVAHLTLSHLKLTASAFVLSSHFAELFHPVLEILTEALNLCLGLRVAILEVLRLRAGHFELAFES